MRPEGTGAIDDPMAKVPSGVSLILAPRLASGRKTPWARIATGSVDWLGSNHGLASSRLGHPRTVIRTKDLTAPYHPSPSYKYRVRASPPGHRRALFLLYSLPPNRFQAKAELVSGGRGKEEAPAPAPANCRVDSAIGD